MNDNQKDILDNVKIAVLLPCYNEEVTVKKVVEDFKQVLPEAVVYVFDNNSTDQTANYAREEGAIVIHSPAQGKGNVVRHMFQVIEADYYILCDGDDTYPAEAAPILIKTCIKEKAAMVIGVRKSSNKNQAYRRYHRFGNRMFSWLISRLFAIKILDVLSGYRVFSKEFVQLVPLHGRGFEIETELTLQAIAKKFMIKQIPVSYRERPEGSVSKLNTFSDGLLIIRFIIILFRDYKPMSFFTVVGLIFVLTSLSIGIVPIMDYVNFRTVVHLPLAILATGIGILAALTLSIGLILGVVAKYHNETFQLFRSLVSSKEKLNKEDYFEN